MKVKFFYISMLAIFIGVGNALALPAIDGVFGDTTEWAGHNSDDDGVLNSSGYLDPGYGGQAYDVEYLGLYVTATQIAFGLQTGFNLETGTSSYAPGDFALNVDDDPFYEYAVDYSVSGSSASYTLVDMASAGASWQPVAIPAHAISNPWQAAYSSSVGSFSGKFGSGVFGNNSDGGTSYVLEGIFDRSLLSLYSEGPITIHWAMECGNDYLNHTAAVPEPATMLLSGIGLLGMGCYLRRKVRKS